MSTQDNNIKVRPDKTLMEETLDAYHSQTQSEKSNLGNVTSNLRQQFQFPDAIWEKLSKR